jgi:hypothetical protein
MGEGTWDQLPPCGSLSHMPDTSEEPQSSSKTVPTSGVDPKNP